MRLEVTKFFSENFAQCLYIIKYQTKLAVNWQNFETETLFVIEKINFNLMLDFILMFVMALLIGAWKIYQSNVFLWTFT